MRYSLEERRERFIKIANEVHNNAYDYSEMLYINSQIRVEIICPTHGVFTKIPNNHTNGSGCVKCNAEARKRLKDGKY